MKKIGIDIGGTTIKGCLFCGDEIETKSSVPTEGKKGREFILNALFRLTDMLFTPDTEIIGISSAGNIDPVSGVCVYATDNLKGWSGFDIKTAVEERYGVRCLADNDAVCALKGELTLYPECENAAMLTFGTGVGGAALANGKILRGKNFGAARFGHFSLSLNGRKCNCGKRGCSETYVSASALLKDGRKAIKNLSDCEELFELYRKNDPRAVKTIEKFGGYLNLLLDQVRAAIAPEIIILGGGLVGSSDVIGSLIKDVSDVRFARLGNLAGAYGALIERA